MSQTSIALDNATNKSEKELIHRDAELQLFVVKYVLNHAAWFADAILVISTLARFPGMSDSMTEARAA